MGVNDKQAPNLTGERSQVVRYVPRLKVIRHFHNHQAYVYPFLDLAESITSRRFIKKRGYDLKRFGFVGRR